MHNFPDQAYSNLPVQNLNSEEIKSVLEKCPPKRVFEYISHKWKIIQAKLGSKTHIIDHSRFIQCYNLIKADAWPDINSIDDFLNLPKEIIDECNHTHKFHPDIWYDPDLNYHTWQEYTDWNYNIATITRTKHLILDNLDIIENKNIVDFSAAVCFTSSVCLFNNANHVVFTEIRKENYDLAIEHLSIMNYPTTKYQGYLADIHNYTQNTDICRNKDTVIIAGILYHVHDHYNILESVANAKVNAIIIDTKHYNDIVYSSTPLIYWCLEDEGKVDTIGGWYNNQDNIFVGYPNLAWLVSCMQNLGYEIFSQVVYKYDVSDYFNNAQEEIRSVQVFKLKDK